MNDIIFKVIEGLDRIANEPAVTPWNKVAVRDARKMIIDLYAKSKMFDALDAAVRKGMIPVAPESLVDQVEKDTN